MSKSALFAFCALASSTMPAIAQQKEAANDPIVVSGQQYERKVVCKFEQNTGTRFQTRVCHTNREWNEMREQHIRAAQEMVGRVIETRRD